MQTAKIKNLREKVLRTLEQDEQSRNSDIRLMQMIWFTYYRNFLFKNELQNWCIRIANLYELPREDNIKRIRAKIQNVDKKFLPTSQEVRKQRKINEEDWRKHLNYNPELRTI